MGTDLQCFDTDAEQWMGALLECIKVGDLQGGQRASIDSDIINFAGKELAIAWIRANPPDEQGQ